MRPTAFTAGIRLLAASALALICLGGCETAASMRPEQLAAIGVKDGAMYWDAEQKLAQAGYQCHVTGLQREDFDCSKTVGVFPTCVLRIQFKVDERNQLTQLRVANPACIGTP